MKKLLTTVIVVSASLSACAATIYVDPNGTGDYPTIQAAIDDANDGDIIALAAGTYTGDGNRDIDYKGKAITVRGQTGDPNDVIIDCNGTEAGSHRGFNFISGEDTNSILEAITISNGFGFKEYINNADVYVAGGIYCRESSPRINNCIINNNTASNHGGGIYNNQSSPMIENCIISNNSAIFGGGIYNYYGNPKYSTCLIKGNSASKPGGGCYNYLSEAFITDCVIVENSASSGGGFYIYGSSLIISDCIINKNVSDFAGAVFCSISTSIIRNCVINYNSANYDGGGIVNYNSRTKINNCNIINNYAKQYGGGIWNYYNSEPNINSCNLCGNFAGYSGGGIYNLTSNSRITNCTLSLNEASYRGGGIYNYACNAIINSCISWDNIASGGYNEIYNINSTTIPIISYCDIAGSGGSEDWDPNLGTDGGGNIDNDPCFINPDINDLHLKSEEGRWDPVTQSWVYDDVTSPCIDAGEPNSDWTNELWPHGKRINMGAYGGTPQASMSPNMAGNPADFDYDDDVDINDLYLFTDVWPITQVLLKEDINHNGFVDFYDFALFAESWLWHEAP